jgi:hypothetical protein
MIKSKKKRKESIALKAPDCGASYFISLRMVCFYRNEKKVFVKTKLSFINTASLYF